MWKEGIVKSQLGKEPQSAIADFNKAIIISPDDADAFTTEVLPTLN
jgi:hypothetical protein